MMYTSWFNSSGECYICRETVHNAIQVNRRFVCCMECVRENEHAIVEIDSQIRRIVQREQSLWFVIGSIFGICKSKGLEVHELQRRRSVVMNRLAVYREEVEFRRGSYEAEKEFRARIYERDNYRCQVCGRNRIGSRVPFHIHHIKYRCEGGTVDADNLQLLCEICHSKLPKHELVKVAREERLRIERATGRRRRARY